MELFFNLEFSGYLLNAGRLPQKAGVFCIYSCPLKLAGAKPEISLIYVGEGSDIRKSVLSENERPWLQYARADESLCYSYVIVPTEHRKSVAAALISEHGPVANERRDFDFVTTHIRTSGANSGLKPHFSVRADRKDSTLVGTPLN